MPHFLKPLLDFFGKKQPPPANSSLPNYSMLRPSKLLDGSDTATRGQLVQVMMRDVLRKSGIPKDWVLCQIQVTNSRTRGEGIYVRLVVKHWDERLMKYAFAFQKALLTEILQFEPHAASWLQGMSWQFDLANTCTVTELPDSPFWLNAQVSLAQGVDETLTPENDTAQDLEKLFAIRDKELAH